MSNSRFVLDREGNVIDTANSNRAVTHYAVYDTSEKALRESVLIRSLDGLVDKLLVNNQPLVHGPWGDEPFQPPNPENFSLTQAIFHAVKASHLNTRDITASLEHPFGGKLRRDDIGWQDTTSIALFIKDLECLLRDLYGDFGDDVIGLVRDATFNIVLEFLRYVRNDLWLEHQSAVDIDYCGGIGVSEDMGISGSDQGAAQKGHAYLLDRARGFRAKSDTFSPYTAIFLKAFESRSSHDSMECSTAATECSTATTNKVIDLAVERDRKRPGSAVPDPNPTSNAN